MQNEHVPKNRLWIRIWPLYVIAVALTVLWRFDLFGYFSLETLREQQFVLQAFVSENRLAAFAIFVTGYAVVTLLMLPGGLWLTITGGFLFGLFGGTIATIFGATIGASLLFFAAQTSFGHILRKIARPFVARVETEFCKDALSYMFAMRFMPAIPFAVANILPVILGARYRDFFVATVFGIIPGVVAYTWIGAGLGEAFAAGTDPDPGGMFRAMLPPATALCLVSLLPVVWKKFRAGRFF